MIYIHKRTGFWEVGKPLPNSYKTGTTLEDYQSGAYTLLNAEQEAFHKAHPEATQMEAWEMEMRQPAAQPQSEEYRLETARAAKLSEIEAQDAFSNKFFVSVTSGGHEVANQELWIDKDLRNSLYSITLPALQSDGETTTKLWTAGTPPQSVEVPISWALAKLPLLEIYAKRTYDLRAANTAAAYAAQSVEELEAIDAKAGYPNFLTFELNMDLNV